MRLQQTHVDLKFMIETSEFNFNRNHITSTKMAIPIATTPQTQQLATVEEAEVTT